MECGSNPGRPVTSQPSVCAPVNVGINGGCVCPGLGVGKKCGQRL